MSADLYLVAVPIRTMPALVLGTPRPLFATKGGATWNDMTANDGWPDFDVSVDGKRFLAVIPQVSNQQPLTAVLNWRLALLNK